MTVVNREQQRRAGGQVRGQPVEAVQARERQILPRLALALSAQRENRPREPRRALHEPVVALRRQRLEQLPHDPVGERVLERHGAGAQNGHASALGKRGGHLKQRRLADARRTSDDRERAPPDPCGGKQPLDRCDLPLPLEDQAAAGLAERGVGEVSHRHELILASACGDDQLTSSGCGAEKISDAATMRARRPVRILLLMTHTTEIPSPPTTTEPTRGYALERSREEYDRLTRQAALFSGMTQRLFRAAGLAPGMRVLDVGSGAGDVAFLAAELVGPEGAVVGVDVDGAALATARARAELLGLQNVKFVEGDVRTAALGDDFDAAVGRLVLMYLEDPAQALRAIAARVRAGGAIAFQELDLDPGIDGRSLPGGTLWDETGRLVIGLYEIDDGLSGRMHAEVARGHMGAKLAFARLTFNYFISETVFAYILDAVHLIAEHGWTLLPLYRFDPDSGLWRHRAGVPDPPTSLSITLEAGPGRFASAPEGVLAGQLEAAQRVIRTMQAHPPGRSLHDPELSDEFERIRWFPLPGEALEQLRSTVTRSSLAAADRPRRGGNRTVNRRVLQPSDRGGSHGT